MTEPSTAEVTSYKISDSSQKRFSFYNASDYSVEVVGLEPASSDSADDNHLQQQEEDERQEFTAIKQQQGQVQAAPQRFTFYTAQKTPKIDNGSVKIMTARNEQVALQPGHDAFQGANDIVHVHDETLQDDGLESQRQSPSDRFRGRCRSNSNPYEDAIREALELLRKHKTPSSPAMRLNVSSREAITPTDQDELLQSRRTPPDSPINGSVNGNSIDHSPCSQVSRQVNISRPQQVDSSGMESRRQQRQERMAKYANRLAELKQQDCKHVDDTEQCQNNDDDEEEVHVTTSDEASVQAGVERVLLAILERAGSRGRQAQSVLLSPDRSVLPRTAQSHSWSRGEEKKSVEDENALLLAMSDLLGASSFLSPPHPAQYPHSNGYDPVTASRSMDSDKLTESQLQADEEDEGEDDTLVDEDDSVMPPPLLTRTTITHLDTSLEAVEAVATLESPQPIIDLQHVPTTQSQDQHDELDALVRQFSSTTSTSASQRHVIKHPIEERVRQILSSDSISRESRSGEQNGGIPDRFMRTCAQVEHESFSRDDGLVSDVDQSLSISHDNDAEDADEESDLDTSFDDDNNPHDSSVDRVLGPLAKTGTTTGVVLELDPPEPITGVFETISAVMSLVTGDAPVSPASTEATKDRYTSGDDESSDSDDSSTDSDESDFSEADDLMRSLCAHLLPVGVDQTCRVLDPLPEWDATNPDEPGYRIVRLRSAQLLRIEQEFEAMVEKLKRHSERDLCKLGEGGGSDAVFERDLKAAEDLLDREESRFVDDNSAFDSAVAVVKAITPRALVVGKGCEHGAPLSSFPGIKSAGKGEMGDLEFFHLPVIFKSHVTGFEPTKDMYLEAGNIVAGQYLVEGELGSAAFSTAYRCIDLSSDGDGPDGHQEVCLKVIKNTKDFFDQSLDEIKILELLRQTGMCNEKAIVEMKTFFYYREHLIIVTELLRQNLFEFGKFIVEHNEEPYFTLPRLAYITRQCLVALEFVHGLGLCHSDIKPENILLASYSHATIKLIDFGSSCYLTDRQSSYIQSRSYRAPEVVLGLPYDGRIDVWSLGCVVAEMYTGEVTFQNDSVVSMLSRIESICGPFPRHMIAQGRQSGRFFTKCGLLFERVAAAGADESSARSDTDGSVREHYDIFQPKITTLSSRLGFDADLMECFDSEKTLSAAQSLQALFCDFVRKLLTIAPDARLTASEALQHPWMQYASTLTEDDVKYPSSTSN
ncbi:hypothetical protein MPSEU_000999800 [Mayamaea pseudoterrestris]|nr:hypothetical protein MPSEU_000999800 [Mayamaea pseudoterrestris]